MLHSYFSNNHEKLTFGVQLYNIWYQVD